MSANPRRLQEVGGDDYIASERSEVLVELQRVEVLADWFQHEGWTVFADILRDAEAQSMTALASYECIGDAIPAYRARLRIVKWLLEIPETVKQQRDTLASQLEELEAPEEE